MRRRGLPALGSVKLAEIQRVDLQELVDRLVASGLSASTVQCTLLPIRAVFRRALSRGELALNPTTDLALPAVRGRRERFASAGEAEKLIAAVPLADRAVWATLLFGGLRHGELVAQRAEDVDIAAGVIHVRHGWDRVEGEIELKSNAGRRRVPIAAVLRDHLADHLARTGRHGVQLMFGRGEAIPLSVKALQERADTAWKAAGLERIVPHECRHSFASLMIAAGVNAKALSTFMGHANISITLDRYGHLMPGSEEEAAELLDSYLAADRKRGEETARAAEAVPTGAHSGAQLGEEIQEAHA
jgi:integrase